MSRREDRERKKTYRDRRPLIDASQQDQALRDLMPIMEWVTCADAALFEDAGETALQSLGEAIKALRKMPPNSPAIDAYGRWLEENTRYREAETFRRRFPTGDQDNEPPKN